ncbi:MAG: hypothetical protein JXB36_16270 [Gammaproteobacteria bacterium]|nr:hypothetical protein [Gammaproteobacteria bacterium]
MRSLPAAIRVLAVAAPLGAPAFAHHSQAMFDTTEEILIEGTVARFDWVNPHMYLVVETEGPDGEPVLIEGEGLAITQALVDGLDRDALQPGTPVVVRANPNRGGWGKQVRLLDVTTEDGEIHPFYAANTRARKLTPAESLEGRWAPSRQALGAAFGAMARWPVTPEGRAAQAELVADGLCYVEPTPFLSVLDEMREIDIGEDEVLLHFDNSGDPVVRTVHMDAEHPADVQPSRQGHSVGWWEGDTLVIDTIAFEPNPSGIAANVPSSPRKHTVERLTLTNDRTRLRYEITVDDPVYLTEPATLAQQWDHRPDLPFSPPSEACDPEVAERYIEE